MPQQILALEWDRHELRAAVLETSFRDYRIIGFHREPIAEGNGTLTEHLRAFVAKHKLQGATVLSSMPGDMVTLRTFALPFRDRKRLDQTVPFELESQVPFGLDEVVADYQVIRSDKTGSSVLAVLVQRKDLEEHINLLKEAGLDPKVVDCAPLVALNVLTLLSGSERPDTFAFISSDAAQTMVALYRDKQLVGLRTLTLPAPAHPAETEAAALGNGHPPDDEERTAQLVGDIRWTLMALAGGSLDPGLPCFLLGDGVQMVRLGQQLESGLGCSVRRLDQVPLKAMPANFKAELAGFSRPFGLALREVSAAAAVGVNFRRGEFAYHRGAEEMQRALWRTGAIAAAAIALMFTSMYMEYDRLARRAAVLDAQIRYVFTQTVGEGHKIVDPKSQLQAEIDAKQRELQVLGGIIPMGGITAVDALRTMAMALPESLKIDIDELIMDTDGIRAKAKAESFEAVDTVKQQIEKAHYFADVQVKDARAAADGKGVDFRIVIVLSNEGGPGAGS